MPRGTMYCAASRGPSSEADVPPFPERRKEVQAPLAGCHCCAEAGLWSCSSSISCKRRAAKGIGCMRVNSSCALVCVWVAVLAKRPRVAVFQKVAPRLICATNSPDGEGTKERGRGSWKGVSPNSAAASHSPSSSPRVSLQKSDLARLRIKKLS